MPEAPSETMSYDEYRLWKHNQKRAKKQREFEEKQAEFEHKTKFKEPKIEEEPDFQTYAEYRQWKQDRKQ